MPGPCDARPRPAAVAGAFGLYCAGWSDASLTGDSRVEFRDHTIIVTGGASGLGAAVVERVIGADGRVVIADIDAARGARFAAELGPNARFARVDVTDSVSLQAAIDLACETFGGLSGLVCCAGIAPGAKVVGRDGPHPLDLFARTIQVNLIGTFNAIRLAAARMAMQPAGADGERGVIVCTASVAAFEGQIGQAAYSASKGGIVGMTLPIARELAASGIRIMTIAPGIFATPLLEGLPENVQQSLGNMVPFPSRLGRPAEFARLVGDIFANPMLNGEVIRLDGALRMTPR